MNSFEKISLKLKITGLFEEAIFQDWILHRAKVLGLDVQIRLSSLTEIQCLVSGNPILVEALEIACSLGPINSTVENIEII